MNFDGDLLDGVLLIESDIYNDHRGYFSVNFNRDEFNRLAGYNVDFIQDNESVSKKNVIRGLHYQKNEFAQAKLIRCVNGIIYDVIVDLRPHSKTYHKYMGVVLSQNKMLFIPRGFAHGFSVLSEYAHVSYKTDNFYNPDADTGIKYDDGKLNIDWKINKGDEILSEKDLTLPYLDSTK